MILYPILKDGASNGWPASQARARCSLDAPAFRLGSALSFCVWRSMSITGSNVAHRSMGGERINGLAAGWCVPRPGGRPEGRPYISFGRAEALQLRLGASPRRG